MATSSVLGQEYGYFRGIGGAAANSVLPPQAIPKSKKNKKWNKSCLDGLEGEAMRQYMKNIKYKDYYDMISGKLAYSDILDEDKDSLYAYITDFKKEKLNIPNHIRHHDLFFPILNKIVGEWMLNNDDLRFDTTDDVSTNEYIRERTVRLNKYTEALFQRELEKTIQLLGIEINPNPQSEEEAQQAQQQQEQIIRDYFPENIEADMKKNFKTEAAQWAEKTWERDYERFRMSILESIEARDLLLTGKAPRHYRVGYDYYIPENWHPIETFHSMESTVNRYEDCEFAGRMKWYTVSELMNTYGDILSEKERRDIYKSAFGSEYESNYESVSTYQNTSLLGEGHFEEMMVPFKGYSDHKLALEFEAATGIPLSEKTDLETGEVTPTYSTPLNNSLVGYGSAVAQNLRNDIEIRLDTIQTLEAYWRGSKKVGLLTRRSESGYITTEEIDEDILPEFMSKYGIKKVTNKSLAEYNIMSDEEKENTVIWVDAPMVYRGVKIRVSGIGLTEDIYKVEELPYQIKGERGNIFNVKLPVCGHIGNSYFELIRPYQITYNYLMNQVNDYLQKEIGAFFVIDVNAIPSEYFDLPEGDDALFEIRDLAKTTGFLPTDFSRNNLNQQGGLSFNPMVYNNATFTEPITRNLGLAERYKMMAYETLGLTPQTMNSPSKYSTAEGVQVSQRAQFAQAQNIDKVLMENRRANAEVHMAVAQYCQLNNKDANYIYMASNNELQFLNAIKDEDFELRTIDVRSTYDPRKNMMFQQLKQALISNNTMGGDALAMAELYLSDDYMELKEAAMRARQYGERMQRQKMESDQQISSQNLEAQDQRHQDDMTIKRERMATDIEIKRIDAIGRSADRNAAPEYLKEIQMTTEAALKRQEIENNDANEKARIQNDLDNSYRKFAEKAKQYDIDRERLALEKEKLATQRYVADKTTQQSIINKN